MGLRINTNISSMNARRSLADITKRLATSSRRLSTGLRISTAADDSAGLAISERLRAQIRSLDQAQRNANDGISLVQTAEGALNEVGTILSRLRELSVQSANGTVSGADQDTLNTEFTSLVSEVDRISRSTQFNGINVLDGSTTSVSFQIGIGTTGGVDTLSASLSPALSTTLSLDSLDIGSAGNTATAITSIDAAINTVSGLRGSLGAVQSRLNSTIRNLGVQSESLSAAESRIRDVDVAFETAQHAKNSILLESALAIATQANRQPRLVLSLLA